MKQAHEALVKKDYVKARTSFLKAYHAFATVAQYEKTTQCGVNIAALYHRDHLYKEAFEILRNAEQQIAAGEKKEHKARPDLRYETVKERLRMYTQLKQVARANEQLHRLEDLARASHVDSLQKDLLLTQANHYYTFGMIEKGDKAIDSLVSRYRNAKQYNKVIDCYHTLIGLARKNGNMAMTARAYEQYIVWKDSVRVLKAQDEIAALQKTCADKQLVISEKESALKKHKHIIAALCMLAGILVVALIIGAVILFRFVFLTHKQKKIIAVAHEQNEQKSGFIRHISAQLSPTLRKMDASHPAVKALNDFILHVEEMTDLESHLSEPYEMQEKRIDTFCDDLMNQIKGKVQENVSLVVNAPKLTLPMNPEMLERVLLHLLENAAKYTPAHGKITLEYKKRGAHIHQFIVCDTGCGIEPKGRDSLFKPFSEVKDLTQGDGLGLPLCALIAARMNGSIKLDEEYVKGARFILELHQ